MDIQNNMLSPLNALSEKNDPDKGAALIGMNGKTVAEQITETKAAAQSAAQKDSAAPSAALFNDSINFTSVKNPAALNRNRSGANQDKHFILLGDSHSWGQGAPDWDKFSNLTNWSRHSAFPHAKGFMHRIALHIREKFEIRENTHCLAHPAIAGRVSPLDVRSDIMTDITKTYPIKLECGRLDVSSSNVSVTANTFPNFYAPVARQDVDSYSLMEYREKLEQGLFKNGLMTLSPCSETDFIQEGFNYYLELIPDPAYTPSAGNFAQITSGSESVVVAERNTDTGVFYLVMKNRSFPNWFAAGKDIYIQGYGVVEIHSIVGNGAVRIQNTNGTQIGVSGAPYIYPGMKIYPADVFRNSLLRIEMPTPARVIYVAVQHQANGGKLRVAFTDSISGGAALRPYVNPNVAYRQNANGFMPKFNSGVSVHIVKSGHVLESAAKATVDSYGVQIDTSEISGGGTEEVIYRIDLGCKQQGACYLQAICTTGQNVKTRGVVFDNNKVVNLSMGAHTVGAWVGSQSSNAAETRSHIDDILNYTPVRPSNVIVQLPIVNEYIKQNSIASFKTALATLVDKFNTHLAASNNYNFEPPDFVFFTSLRNKEIAFESAAESSITYDMYTQAAREFCADNNHAFVDCEAELMRLVSGGRVDYERLYNDSNHPSDYANEVIARVLKQDYIDFIC